MNQWCNEGGDERCRRTALFFELQKKGSSLISSANSTASLLTFLQVLALVPTSFLLKKRFKNDFEHLVQISCKTKRLLSELSEEFTIY
jgi:hypothetical protein